MKTINLQEVQDVVFQIKEGTSPDPDGFTINVFHHFWEMVKLDVWKIVEQSRISGHILPALNATLLTLIPKCEGFDTPNKFRPISLCNFIYEIITKVIANRLKPILPSLISPDSLVFWKGGIYRMGLFWFMKYYTLSKENFFLVCWLN